MQQPVKASLGLPQGVYVVFMHSIKIYIHIFIYICIVSVNLIQHLTSGKKQTNLFCSISGFYVFCLYSSSPIWFLCLHAIWVSFPHADVECAFIPGGINPKRLFIFFFQVFFFLLCKIQVIHKIAFSFPIYRKTYSIILLYVELQDTLIRSMLQCQMVFHEHLGFESESLLSLFHLRCHVWQ